MFTAALFITAKIWKQPNCPLIDEWINKMHIHALEYYSVIKKELNIDTCHNMDER